MGITSSGLLEREEVAILGDSELVTKEKADGDADGFGYASANDVTALEVDEQNRLAGDAMFCCGFTVMVPPNKSDITPVNTRL